MRVAFVLSGGGSLGAAQAGMLQALYEQGIRPDLLVGTSAGAINAAFIASRPPSVETAHELQQIWRGLRRCHVFPASPVTAGLGFLGLRDHSVSAAHCGGWCRRHLEIDRLEEAPVELHVVAADVLSGKEVRLSSGSVEEAILASAAIPGVFPAVPWESQLLMDGGIVNNTPISHASRARSRPRLRPAGGEHGSPEARTARCARVGYRRDVTGDHPATRGGRRAL